MSLTLLMNPHAIQPAVVRQPIAPIDPPQLLAVPDQSVSCVRGDQKIQCGSSCDWIFERVRVNPLMRGGTRVEWVVHPQFREDPPHTFQLQLGRTGNNESDDWCDVGDPVVDTYFATDPVQRAYGKFQWTHYRVLMTTVRNTYASRPEPALGNLDKRDWLRVREISRLENLRLRKEAGSDGYLLKRRLFGPPCTSCLDTQTGEIRNPDCNECYGTGFISGYYEPYPCFYVELSTVSHRSHQDANRGTVDDLPRVAGRMLNYPQIFSRDIWVERDTDFRWMIHSIKAAVEVRGMPVVLHPVEMRMLPYSHPAYKVVIADQVGV